MLATILSTWNKKEVWGRNIPRWSPPFPKAFPAFGFEHLGQEVWGRNTPPLERGASELPLLLLCLRGAPSTVRQFALDQLYSSLLLTSFKV